MDGLENGSHGIPSITSEVLHVLTKALKTSQIRVEALEKTLDDLKVSSTLGLMRVSDFGTASSSCYKTLLIDSRLVPQYRRPELLRV